MREMSITEEVEIEKFLIQSNAIEGITDPVTAGDVAVVWDFVTRDVIKISDVSDLVYYFQPDARLRDGIGCHVNVRLGIYNPPPAGHHIIDGLNAILEKMNLYSENPYQAYDLHIEYESLHPYSDGNGRSGRILLFRMLRGNFGPYDFLTWWYIQTMRNYNRSEETNYEQ